MLHDSKTCPPKESDISIIARTDRQMVWWVCDLLETENHLKICKRGWVLPISWMFFCQKKLRWCGDVEKMNKENPVNNSRFVEVGAQRGKGRQYKT